MNLLNIIIFLPLLGALACLIVPKRQVRVVAVLASAATFLVSLGLFSTFLGGTTNTEENLGTQ